MRYMNLSTFIEQKNLTKYGLSKISGIPKTTIIDICSGKSSIQKCAALTVKKLADALDCTMEDIMEMDDAVQSKEQYDQTTGLPVDKEYLECALPEYLQHSINNMRNSWAIKDSGKTDLRWDLYWCELNADINSAEVDNLISSEQAWYLREKYLRMKRS